MMHSQQTVQSMIDTPAQALGAVCSTTVRWKSIRQLCSYILYGVSFFFVLFFPPVPPPLSLYFPPQSELKSYGKMLRIHLLAWERSRERGNRERLHCIALQIWSCDYSTWELGELSNASCLECWIMVSFSMKSKVWWQRIQYITIFPSD